MAWPFKRLKFLYSVSKNLFCTTQSVRFSSLTNRLVFCRVKIGEYCGNHTGTHVKKIIFLMWYDFEFQRVDHTHRCVEMFLVYKHGDAAKI